MSNRISNNPNIRPHSQYTDSSAKEAISTAERKLANQPDSKLSGQEMVNLVKNATQDLDGQAAGLEHKDLIRFVMKNNSKLSPEAKMAWNIYDKKATEATAKGQTGIPQNEWNSMIQDMQAHVDHACKGKTDTFSRKTFLDETSGNAVKQLQRAETPISGKALEDAVYNGTKDLDSQAAGKEYKDLSGFVQKNWKQLSPDAKAKWRVYETKVQEMQSKDQTGIPQKQYNEMMEQMRSTGYEDQGAGKVIEHLRAGKTPVSGERFEKALYNATVDLDAQAAGKEYNDLKKYVESNPKALSKEALAKWELYEKKACECQKRGLTGIPQKEYDQLFQDMKLTGYEDITAGRAIETLKEAHKPISGKELGTAIFEATKDLDGQAAGKEFNDLNKYVKDNWKQLSPDAKAKWEVYNNKAQEMHERGMSGIPKPEYDVMIDKINSAGYLDPTSGEAVEFLKEQKQPISGAAMQYSIGLGTADFDNQAAGKEFKDLNTYVKANWDKLSPDAKAKWRVYEETANQAQAQGNTGIPVKDYAMMLGKMLGAGYEDQGAGKAVESLHASPKPISGEVLQKAVIEGTIDLDGKAASTEFNDLKNYTQANWENLSSDAKAKWSVYEEKVHECQERGLSGIPKNEYDQMIEKMGATQYLDSTSGDAVESLRAEKKPISGKALEEAVYSGTKDLDSQAASNEYKDLSSFVQNNWKDLSTDAKAKWRVYDNKAKEMQSLGKTGIPQDQYNQMIEQMKGTQYNDQVAGEVIESLYSSAKPISGDAFQTALFEATKDLDNQAAGAEYKDLKTFVTNNQKELSPEAMAKFDVYEKKALECQERGLTGIPKDEYDAMIADMRLAGYNDVSSAQAIDGLKQQEGPISGEKMQEAIIAGTQDLDSQAASTEFADFEKFVSENKDRLSPEANNKFDIYSKYAASARERGLSGIPKMEYDQMVEEMKGNQYKDETSGASIEYLKSIEGPIDTFQFLPALMAGIADLDSQSYGKEFEDFRSFVEQNPSKLTPDAKDSWKIYSNAANQAREKGETGASLDELASVLTQMLFAALTRNDITLSQMQNIRR